MANIPTAFKVVKEQNCPFYKVNHWFILNNRSVKVPDGLPSCLILVREFTSILFSLAPGGDAVNSAAENGVFSCGGCTGLIKFRADEMPEEVEESLDAPAKNRAAESGGTIPGREKKRGAAVSGSLEEISPSELLQFFHMHQKTGKLLLEVSDGTARVAFREGAIIGARYGEKEDKDAVFSILGEGRGKFSFVAGIPGSLQEVDDIGDFMMILMEGLKMLDEHREDRK